MMRRRFQTAALMLAAAIALAPTWADAQQASEDEIAATLAQLREAPDVLGSRTATLQRRVDRQNRFLTRLRQRLNDARSEPEAQLRAYRSSLYSYQIFLLTSRMAAEAGKLSETERLLALAGQAGSNDAPALVRRTLEAAARSRIDNVERQLREAKQYRDGITEPGLRAQFEQLLTRIQGELDRLREAR
jgi:hypothetical protein